MVYEELLIQKEPIPIQKDYLLKQPALTRVNRQIRQESRKIYYLKNEFLYPLSYPWPLTTYCKIVRRANLDGEGFRNQITCQFWDACAVGPFVDCLREFYLYGGQWPAAYSSDVGHRHASRRRHLLMLVEHAQAFKSENMSWKAAKAKLRFNSRGWIVRA